MIDFQIGMFITLGNIKFDKLSFKNLKIGGKNLESNCDKKETLYKVTCIED